MRDVDGRESGGGDKAFSIFRQVFIVFRCLICQRYTIQTPQTTQRSSLRASYKEEGLKE